MLSVPEAAYLAGLIDGEGCISIEKNSRAGYSPQYALKLTIKMTDRATIDRVRDLVGGGNITHTSYTGDRTKTRWKDSYTWRATHWAALEVIQQVYPYLFTKRKEAEIALEFMANCSIGRRGNTPLTPELLALREEYKQKLSEAKGRL